MGWVVSSVERFSSGRRLCLHDALGQHKRREVRDDLGGASRRVRRPRRAPCSPCSSTSSTFCSLASTAAAAAAAAGALQPLRSLLLLRGTQQRARGAEHLRGEIGRDHGRGQGEISTRSGRLGRARGARHFSRQRVIAVEAKAEESREALEAPDLAPHLQKGEDVVTSGWGEEKERVVEVDEECRRASGLELSREMSCIASPHAPRSSEVCSRSSRERMRPMVAGESLIACAAAEAAGSIDRACRHGGRKEQWGESGPSAVAPGGGGGACT